MKRIILTFFAFLPLALLAQSEQPMAGEVSEETTETAPQQTLLFGYLSYDAVMKTMPEYVAAQDTIRVEREAFEKEMKRIEDEFNQKYESFLEGQREFPRTILLKRQNELQELMQRNVEFKAQAREELRKREEQLMMPVRIRLNEGIAAIARKNGLALVVNTDTNACPFIEPSMGLSIQNETIELLK